MIGGFRVERVIRTRANVSTQLEATAPDGERVMLTVIAADKELRAQLLGLARLRTTVQHPNLLRFHSAHHDRDRVYLVSAVPGPTTLADKLREGPLDPDEAVTLLGQVAGALETAADSGLLHRDLTPEEIALKKGSPPRAVLTDMGIAMPPAGGCELLSVGDGIDYRSPEEVRGEPLEPESNVYSLACILVECLTGTPPYPYARALLTLHAHVVEPSPRPSERNPDLPPALDAVVAKAMAKDPRERFDSPARLIRAAGDALGKPPDVPVVATPKKERRLAPTPATLHRPRPRSRLPTAGIALALCASVVGGFVAGSIDWSGDPRTTPAAVASPSPADPDRFAQAAYADDAGNTVDRLRARRALARRQLRAASRHTGQAAAATALARAYREARRTLPRPQPGVSGDSRLAEELRLAERAYRRLAAAARAHNQGAWRAARRETLRREGALRGALREVRLS